MNNADKAAKLVLGDRNDAYGNPREDFEAVGVIWTALLAQKMKPESAITPEDVALMMVALKLRREAFKPKEDNLIDAHGYLLCLEWIRKGQRPTPLVEDGGET